MNDDLDNTLRDSLDHHAAATSHAYGNLDDVVQRVELKHRRRRSLAVIGSVAALAGGVIGFAAFAAGSSDPSVDLAAAAASDGPTTTIAPNTNVYACANYLGSQDDPTYGQREIYGDCVVVTWDTGIVPGTAVTGADCVVTTTIPPTTTTIPITMATLVTSPANATASATGCGDPAAGLPSDCFPVMTTTTSVAYLTGTMPAGTTVCEAYADGTAPPLTAPPTSSPSNTIFNCLSNPSATEPYLSTTTGANSGEQQYTAVDGDSLFGIAALYGVTPEIIANYNGWTDCLDHPLVVGEVVRIPPGAVVPTG